MITWAAGLLIFYYYLFIGLRTYRESHPESAPGELMQLNNYFFFFIFQQQVSAPGLAALLCLNPCHA